MTPKKELTSQEADAIGKEFDQDLATSVEADYNTDREGVHVSDIYTYCMRQQVFRKLQRVPLSPEDTANFVKGKSAHGCIESLLKHHEGKYTAEEQHRINWKGITGTPDVIHAESGIIFEIKTIRLSKLEAPNNMNVKQLKAYMALAHQKYGFIQYILGGTKTKEQRSQERTTGIRTNPWVKFKVVLEEEEAEKIRQELLDRLQTYNMALEYKDPKLAPHVANDEEFLDRYRNNWKCETCAYKEQCYAMNREDAKEELDKK